MRLQKNEKRTRILKIISTNISALGAIGIRAAVGQEFVSLQIGEEQIERRIVQAQGVPSSCRC